MDGHGLPHDPCQGATMTVPDNRNDETRPADPLKVQLLGQLENQPPSPKQLKSSGTGWLAAIRKGNFSAWRAANFSPRLSSSIALRRGLKRNTSNESNNCNNSLPDLGPSQLQRLDYALRAGHRRFPATQKTRTTRTGFPAGWHPPARVLRQSKAEHGTPQYC